ncbi:MAG: hypothetical protein IJ912_01615 [Fibrobacter sp.]|nr:hypothetical protein [Fibrobacter sp.]
MEDELDSSTDELLFLPLTELELFCESSPDFTDEEDFELPPEDVPLSVIELEDRLTEDEESPTGSGETEEEESSPHATSIVRRTDRAKTLLKIFTEPPVTSIVFDKFS